MFIRINKNVSYSTDIRQNYSLKPTNISSRFILQINICFAPDSLHQVNNHLAIFFIILLKNVHNYLGLQTNRAFILSNLCFMVFLYGKYIKHSITSALFYLPQGMVLKFNAPLFFFDINLTLCHAFISHLGWFIYTYQI